MLKKLLFFVLFIAIWIMSGCAQTEENTGDYQDITAGQLREMMENEQGIYLLDVREPHELEDTGHIPGARNIPVGDIEKNLDNLPETGKLIIYCRSGRRSADVAKHLAERGYTNVYNLQGGIIQWSYEIIKPDQSSRTTSQGTGGAGKGWIYALYVA